jgi:hypothetical protein
MFNLLTLTYKLGDAKPPHMQSSSPQLTTH